MNATSLTVSGTARHPSLGGRTATGTLVFTAEALRFEGGDVRVELPLRGLLFQAGGHNGEQIFFQNAFKPDWLLATGDRAILQHPVLQGDPLLRRQAQAAARRRISLRKFVGLGVVCLALLLALVATVASQKSRLARAVVDRLPASWEEQFGDAVFQSIRQQTQIIEDEARRARLEVVTRRLLPAVTNRNLRFQFHIAQAKELNAFAIPGGHVVVHTGLLDAVARPEELAGVLAHEIAHVTLRHSLRNMVETA
ncbi:MAG TPA: M48 family metalloprotease, partial [Methylomirabilota bacterium]|nr:M48 family metalloprotease [Methylomirabilota bacterium]